MSTNKWREGLREHMLGCAFLVDTPMSQHTTLRIGGPADMLLDAASGEEIVTAARFCQRLGVPVKCMGNGSNLLVRDGGIRGLVVRVGSRMGLAEIDGFEVRAQAGISMPKLSRMMCENGLKGLSWAAGVPGALGGALCMNAGAYGGSTSDCVVWADVLTPEGDVRRWGKDDLRLSYRHSALADEGCVALAVGLQMQEGQPDALKAEADDFNARRREKQPLTQPSAGSAFKRPPGGFAAQMIDEAGLKGLAVGGAQVSTLHAGFIVNVGGATASNVLELMRQVIEAVRQKTGVTLEPEVQIWGED